jgi:peptidylprolyl isomerase
METSMTKITMTKLEKRAVSKARRREAQARAAAAKRRRQLLNVGSVALVVIVVIVGGYLLFGRGKGTPKATGTAGPSASATATAQPSFPPLPSGADPALAKKPTVHAGTGSLTKLKVTTLIKGTGAATQSGQAIVVNYVGVSFKTGVEFDSSWKRSDTFSFTLGQGGVIPGWDQGLVGVTVGSRVQLDIPAALAYGENPQGGQPAGALRFVVDLLSAKAG